MGLDLVEFMMRVEEEFDVFIPDQNKSLMYTPKDMIEYLADQPSVMKKFGSRDKIAERFWEAAEDELGIDPTEFSEDADFIREMNID